MTKTSRTWLAAAVAMAAVAVTGSAAHAQTGLAGRISVEPYAAYGFYGNLPDGGPELKSAPAFGARAAYQLSPQWAVFGNYQRSQPEVGDSGVDVKVDHWSTGVEFSYAPRGGAEGILPILLEAGVGQARYSVDGGVLGDSDRSDLAVNIGIGSALQLTRNVAVRYGVNDYISNFDDRGITNQIFAKVGAEITF